MLSAHKIGILKDSFKKVDHINKRIISYQDEQEKIKERKLAEEATTSASEINKIYIRRKIPSKKKFQSIVN